MYETANGFFSILKSSLILMPAQCLLKERFSAFIHRIQCSNFVVFSCMVTIRSKSEWGRLRNCSISNINLSPFCSVAHSYITWNHVQSVRAKEKYKTRIPHPTTNLLAVKPFCSNSVCMFKELRECRDLSKFQGLNCEYILKRKSPAQNSSENSLKFIVFCLNKSLKFKQN